VDSVNQAAVLASILWR